MNDTPSGKSTRWARGLGLLSFMLLCGVAFSLLDVWRADRATRWPTVDGTIVESRSVPGCGRSGTGYRVSVRYTYKVDSIAYQDQRILFGAASCRSKVAAEALTGQFPVASIVKVGYDPEDPAEAVLLAGKVDDSTWTAIAFLSFWFLSAGAATGVAVHVERTRRRPSPGMPPQRTLGKRP